MGIGIAVAIFVIGLVVFIVAGIKKRNDGNAYIRGCLWGIVWTVVYVIILIAIAMTFS